MRKTLFDLAPRFLAAGGAFTMDILTLAARVRFHPDPVQTRLLSSVTKRVILNCTRQWGKSTVTALKAVHWALSRPGSLILVTAKAERQSGEFVKKAAVFLKRLKIRPRGDGVNRISLLLPNGSRIVAVPSTDATSRGFSAVDLLIVDEAAYAPDHLMPALRPMLATTGGSIWLLSTPRGKRGFFYKTWSSGDPAWERVKVTAAECPRITEEFLEEEKRELTEADYLQQYCGEFITSDEYIFDRDLIEACVSSEEKSWNL